MAKRYWNSKVFLLAFFLSAILSTATAQLDPTGEWRFHYSLPTGADYHAAYAPSEDVLYCGGDGGIIMRWDGSTWTWMSTPTDRNIYAMHGSSESNIWAVGGNDYSLDVSDRTVVLRYDGSTWQNMPLPSDSFDQEPVLGCIYVFGPDDVWVGGDLGFVFWHWDGSKWEYFPPVGLAEGGVRTLLGFPNGELYAAGTHGQILHYENSTWTMEQKLEDGNFSTNILQAIWGSDPDTVYAGGNFGQAYRRDSMGAWVDAGLPTGIDYNIWSAWQRSPSEVYLVSSDSIRRWDMVNPPVLGDYPGTSRGYWLGATGSGDVLYGFGPEGVATRLDTGSAEPTIVSLSAGGEITFDYRIVGADSCGPNGVLVYGRVNNAQDQMPLYYYDGLVQKPFPIKPSGMNQQGWITAVLSTGPNDIIMAWNDYTFGRGVHHWNGVEWISLDNPLGEYQPSSAFKLLKTPSGMLYGADSSRVVRWDGERWYPVVTREELDDTPDDQPWFASFWARDDADLFVGSTDGRIYHSNGSQWSLQNTPPEFPEGASTIIGNATETLAFGIDGAAWLNSGNEWTQFPNVETRQGDNFVGACVTDDGIFAAQVTNPSYFGGGLSRVWEFSNGTLSAKAVGVSGDFAAIAATSNGVIYALDGSNTIVTNDMANEAPTVQSIQLSADAWTPIAIGSTGVEIKPATPEARSAVVAAARVNRPADFLEVAIPEAQPVPVQWAIYEDESYQSSAIGMVYLRVPASGPGSLYHLHPDSGWETVAATYNSVSGTLETNEPVSLSLWTAGQDAATPTDIWLIY